MGASAIVAGVIGAASVGATVYSAHQQQRAQRDAARRAQRAQEQQTQLAREQMAQLESQAQAQQEEADRLLDEERERERQEASARRAGLRGRQSLMTGEATGFGRSLLGGGS